MALTDTMKDKYFKLITQDNFRYDEETTRDERMKSFPADKCHIIQDDGEWVQVECEETFPSENNKTAIKHVEDFHGDADAWNLYRVGRTLIATESERFGGE